jgi:hypothetical protein
VRLLVLYLRSRHVPVAVAAAVGGVAGLWLLGQAFDGLRADPMLGLLAVVAGTAAAGPGLAGADGDLDRTAALPWPPRRAAHAVAAGAAVAGIVAAAALTGDQFAPVGRVVRDAAGMSGLLALGAAGFGASRAWLPPLTWTLVAWNLPGPPWPVPAAATVRQVLTWMLQPANTAAATVTALALATTGVLAYARLGARR